VGEWSWSCWLYIGRNSVVSRGCFLKESGHVGVCCGVVVRVVVVR
jgi:hypothetical protein